jgi:hypothetical protein
MVAGRLPAGLMCMPAASHLFVSNLLFDEAVLSTLSRRFVITAVVQAAPCGFERV